LHLFLLVGLRGRFRCLDDDAQVSDHRR